MEIFQLCPKFYVSNSSSSSFSSSSSSQVLLLLLFILKFFFFVFVTVYLFLLMYTFIFCLSFLCSPQESEANGALLTAEVVIECLRTSHTNLIRKLKEEMASGKTIFNSRYFEIQYTGKQLSY